MYRIMLFVGIFCAVGWADTGKQPPDPKEVDKDKEFFFNKGHKKYPRYEETCLDKSYISAVKKNYETTMQVRNEDLDYSTCVDLDCCCAGNIRLLFSDKTEDMTHKRVNPAVDMLIKALLNQRMASDVKIMELVHLKYANAIYSFYDDDRVYKPDGLNQRNLMLTMPKDNEDGCKDEIKFRVLKEDDVNRKGAQRIGILKDMMGILHAYKKSADMVVEKNNIKMVE